MSNDLLRLSLQIDFLSIEEKGHVVLLQVQVHCAHPTLIFPFSCELVYFELLKPIKGSMILRKCLMHLKRMYTLLVKAKTRCWDPQEAFLV